MLGFSTYCFATLTLTTQPTDYVTLKIKEYSKACSMDITATLKEIATLKVEDRIRLVQAIWDSIAAEQAYPELTEEQKQELDNRIAESDDNPDNVMSWEEIKDSIRRR